MTARNKPLSGGRTSKNFSSEERTAYVAEGLARWRRLAESGEARDEWAADLWRRKVEPLHPKALLDEKDEGAADQKSRLKNTAEALKQAAHELVEQPDLNAKLNELWTGRYRELESEWKQKLRWLRRLVLPRKGDFKQGNWQPPLKCVQEM